MAKFAWFDPKASERRIQKRAEAEYAKGDDADEAAMLAYIRTLAPSVRNVKQFNFMLRGIPNPHVRRQVRKLLIPMLSFEVKATCASCGVKLRDADKGEPLFCSETCAEAAHV